MTPQNPRVAKVAGLFDALSGSYDASGVAFFQPIASGLVAALAPQPGERVLDVGCGRGAVLLPAARAVAPTGSAVGFDVSAGMVAQCRAAIAAAGVTNATAVVGDAHDPSPLGEPFDVVASSLVLFFLPEPEAALRRWRDLMRPGARLGVTTFAEIDPRWVALDEVFTAYLPPDLRDARTTGATGPFASDAGMVDLLAAAGFAEGRTVQDTVDVRFESAEQWQAWSMSTGQRAMWLSVPDGDRESVAAEAAARLREHAAADGSVTFSQGVRHTLAVRP
jgi:ubiquinone/menaquinone biosynthesis C-methylase UbiE